MLISCKCLNFVAGRSTSRSSSSGNIHQFDKNDQPGNNYRRSSSSAAVSTAESNASGAVNKNRCTDAPLVAVLKSDFSQKFPKSCIFYPPCKELFEQAIGPLAELSVTIHQRDLICTLPCNTWILNICINCNTAVCAKHMSDAVYLINSTLLTSNEELVHRKADRSFSDTFGILIMNHQFQKIDENPHYGRSNESNNRLRSLKQSLQSRLQKEIADTDERIHRYTEQQCALLKSLREKSEQEYQILVSLVDQVPEQMLDAMGAASNAAASAPTTPTILTNIMIGGGPVVTSNSSASAMDSCTQVSAPQRIFSYINDTPPATPDSTPMSVGNSPTFNRQQQTNTVVSGALVIDPIAAGLYGVDFINARRRGDDDDCLFELEGVESYSTAPRTSFPLNTRMSDVEESAEDAEDALAELEAAIPIPGGQARKQNMSNFAKSLPIAIANSVNESTIIADSDDDILDDNVDIAASIKALAKSVHGDAVFGDLPRPRLRTQI